MDATGAPVSPVVVGRARERAELAALLAAARASETGLVLLSGEAGVGKTRLVDEAARLATSSGMRVLSGHCVQLGSEGLPFAPLVEALRDLTRSTSPEELATILGPARRLLPRLMPALGEMAEGAPEQGSQLLESVLSLLERIAADQPLLVVLEDLHWADRSTLDLAAYLVQALRGVPVALLVTYRSDELHRRHPLRSLVVGWERMRSVRHLELSRFDLDEVRELTTAILGSAPGESVVETVFSRSEGNAFLVEELVGVVRDGGDAVGLPPSLRDLLLARVDALGEEAQRLVQYAAVGGAEVDEPLLLAAAGDSPAAALPALREAVEAHLLVVAGGGYRFRHALARDAVYDDMLPGERSRMHGAYGAAIDARSRAAPGPDDTGGRGRLPLVRRTRPAPRPVGVGHRRAPLRRGTRPDGGAHALRAGAAALAPCRGCGRARRRRPGGGAPRGRGRRAHERRGRSCPRAARPHPRRAAGVRPRPPGGGARAAGARASGPRTAPRRVGGGRAGTLAASGGQRHARGGGAARHPGEPAPAPDGGGAGEEHRRARGRGGAPRGRQGHGGRRAPDGGRGPHLARRVRRRRSTSCAPPRRWPASPERW